ncbi:GreA/GreB family elongation factor [Rhizobiales bacterium GAS113]|nr:GreA/GreB family elongation factor [Rhizobiales bacterium GAS113]
MTNLHDQPSIVISSNDYDQLERLAVTRLRSNPSTARVLADELDRATILPREDMARKVVTMHSELTFRDDTTDQTRRMTLVYPGEQDIALGRISVLTPVGAALIGLSEGQSIGWRTPTGERRRLTVLKVHSQPRRRRRIQR